ncbi:hypothetical protein [Streptomyces sp. NBC_00151]|uniref:hypothetical protein n=1 Tax=Streptomyces sp. NBC_00151 TaxID=2975669 RepID=UPI002DDBCAEC|nr:hypothetical protein [Streptomyces sp. NBC_00151]WRZ36772.1 hypothetical protein OG915_00965 [Streptomyces sp. NBC_00151]WRZ44805.1 hypothetical protein OG915_46595 [Streptomyces sp. NBC_00151]
MFEDPMPDKDKDSDKYDHGGFQQGSDGGVYAVLDGSGSSADYASWDWKQIKAAITGGAAYSTMSGGAERAAGVSDPASLWRAGNVLLEIQRVLEMVGQQLDDQATAVAGGEGAVWRGEAAQQFLLMMRGFSQKVQAAAEVLSGGNTGINSVPNQLVANGNSLSQAIALVEAIDSHYANQAKLMGVAVMDNGLIPVSQKPQVVELLNRDMRRVLMDLADHYSITINAIRQPPPVTNPLAGAPNEVLSQLGALNAPNALDTLPPASGDVASLDQLGGLGGPLDVPQEFTAPDLASAPGIGGAGLGLGDNGLAPTEFSGAGLDAPLTSAAPFTPQEFPGSLDLDSGIGGPGADSSAPFLNTPLLPPAPLARSANSDTRVSGVTEFPGLTTPALDVPSFERRGGLPVSTDQGASDTSFTLPEYSPAEFPGLPGLESSGGDGAGGSLSSSGGLPSEFSTQTGAPDVPSELAGADKLSASYSDQPSVSDPGVFTAGGQGQLTGGQLGAGMPGSGMPMMPGMGGAGSPGGAGEPSDASGLLIPGAEPWREDQVFDDMNALVEGEIVGAAAGSDQLIDATGEAVEEVAWGQDEAVASSGADGNAGAQGHEPAATEPQTTSLSADPGEISPPDVGVDTGAALTGAVATAAAGAVLASGTAVAAAAAHSRRSTRADESRVTLTSQPWGDDSEVNEAPQDSDDESAPDTASQTSAAPNRSVTDDWDVAGSLLGRNLLNEEAEEDSDRDPSGEGAARPSSPRHTSLTGGREGQSDEQPLPVWRPARSVPPPPMGVPVGAFLRSGGEDAEGSAEPSRDSEADAEVESRAASRIADLLSQSGATWDGDGDRRAAPGVLE